VLQKETDLWSHKERVKYVVFEKSHHTISSSLQTNVGNERPNRVPKKMKCQVNSLRTLTSVDLVSDSIQTTTTKPYTHKTGRLVFIDIRI